jgi:hypothetical protein
MIMNIAAVNSVLTGSDEQAGDSICVREWLPICTVSDY